VLATITIGVKRMLMESPSVLGLDRLNDPAGIRSRNGL